jgi:hypothetical protein
MLSDRLLAIPDYQRAYSWELDEVQDLWNDLSDAIAADVDEYFLGSVVTTRSEGVSRQQVIDGQQRLATVSLMYAVLRDIFAARSDERWRDIERDLLGKQHMVTRVREARLVLNAEDNDFFRKLTLERAESRDPAPVAESHKRLLAAFKFFEVKFSGLIEGLGPNDWQKPLLQWYGFVFENARLIDVSVTGEARAFIIFETLNDRGLNLSTSDLLKNHLFGKAADRLEEAKVRWNWTMTPFVTGGAGELDADTFLKHFWASKKGVVRVKALYSQIKPEVQNPEEAVGLAAELAEASPLWAAMFDRDSELWKSYPPGALAALDTLRNLNVEQCRPLLLASLRKFPASEVEKLLRLVVGWSIRWFVVGGGGGGVVEGLYAKAAKQVTDGTFTTSAHVAEYFSNDVPNDLRFQRAFSALTVRRGWLARYYLTALEKAEMAEDEPELVPNENVDQVNLEHVLPKNADPKEWSAFSEDELQNMKLMMGNQALLRKSHNRLIGNEPFSVKKPVLHQSDLRWTKEIGERDDWTPEAIQGRQDRMAALAVKIWRRD